MRTKYCDILHFRAGLPFLLVVKRTLIRVDFDHMLGDNFRTVNTCHAISKTTLQFVIFVKIHLNTCRAPKIYLLQNRYQKFS